jgi:hypothetical protein
MDAVVVKLDGSEYLHAMIAGCMRASQNRKLNRRHAHGASAGDSEQCHITGAVGEACVAKMLKSYWLGVGKFRGPDVSNIQVRTRSKPHHSLILHREDSDSDVFVSVYAAEGVGEVRGWIYGRDGKREEFWSDPASGRPAFFVPNEALRPIEELPGWRTCINA